MSDNNNNIITNNNNNNNNNSKYIQTNQNQIQNSPINFARQLSNVTSANSPNTTNNTNINNNLNPNTNNQTNSNNAITSLNSLINNSKTLSMNSNGNNSSSTNTSTNSPMIARSSYNPATDTEGLDRLDLNELDSLIRLQKSSDFFINGTDDELNKIKNRRSVIDPLANIVVSRPHHHRHRYETILYKELLSLGIKKDKLEKALAATGYQNSIDAVNWLMKHAKDPILNLESVISTRDYILVLCPVGRLANQIATFFQQAKLKIGPNEAHYNNLLPYMKLSPFFKIPDSQLSNLHKAFDKTFKASSSMDLLADQFQFINGNNLNSLNGNSKQTKLNEINLDLHVSPQMILLYPDIESENSIKEIVSNFSKSAIKYTNYEIIPYSKQLHLTLGYNYEPEHKRILEDLAIQNINYRLPAEWEVRLYSRDSRADSKLTYKVISTYKPKSESELYIKVNDYVFANNSSKDNLMKGVSFTTGENGYFPAKNVERSIESDTWKLHKSHLLVGSSTTNGTIKQPPQSVLDKRASYQLSESKSNIAMPFFYSENPTMQKRFQANPHRAMQSQGTLRFFFTRHGERVDLAFGPQWIETSFDRSGKYRRTNLNMPTDLPYRPSKREFLGDSPLTEIGQFQARLTGEALGNEGYKIHYCYTSPALRCIQTAHQILTAQGLEKTVKIRIEPSVFEFLGWYDKGLPTFVNPESLVQFGFNIDVNYRPLLPLERLQPDENYTDYYQRSFNVTKYLTNLHQNEGANILVVGHAGTLEVCTRQICGLPVRPYTEFNATIRKVPYLGLAMLEKEAGNNSFEIQQAVIPALGHTANFNFDPLSLKM